MYSGKPGRMMPYDLSDFVMIDLDPDDIPKEHTKYQILIFVYMQKIGHCTSF